MTPGSIIASPKGMTVIDRNITVARELARQAEIMEGFAIVRETIASNVTTETGGLGDEAIKEASLISSDIQEDENYIGGEIGFSNGEGIEFLGNKTIDGDRIEITDIAFYPTNAKENELANEFGPRAMLQTLGILKKYAREKGFKQIRIHYERASHSSSAKPGKVFDRTFDIK